MNQATPNPAHVSVHGGHSGEFCCHARDFLEDIVKAYVRQRFTWVGITEHMPPVSDAFMYPDERASGWDAGRLYDRFEDYMTTAGDLKARYAGELDIYVGFETEFMTRSLPFTRRLIETFRPDYFVGSLHHVNDISFDFSREDYLRAVEDQGGIDNLYERYFDQQYELIDALNPAVIGHFDLIRIYDEDYKARLEKPEIALKIDRNLALIAERGLILDFNLAALSKGMDEPYISAGILEKAKHMGIAVVPGDDSHSVDTVGRHMEKGIELLNGLGFSTTWKRPA
ncbi:MAG: histidinol-phosphatase [Desulfobacterales bacterium]|nr:histidinol-phosphatase [Desulfobacterales bacterium]